METIRTELRASTQMKERRKLKTKTRMKRMMMMKKKCLMQKMQSLTISLTNRESW
jgi:hypothetical protein